MARVVQAWKENASIDIDAPMLPGRCRIPAGLGSGSCQGANGLQKTRALLPCMSANRLLTAQQLAEELNLPNADFVKLLARKRKIPVIRFGHRTIRFDLAKCREAIAKLEVRAVV